jgi:RNA polymerase primary sigma factor
MRTLKIAKQITKREDGSLDKYLQEISKIDLISAEEEVALTRRIKEGDEIALAKMVNANLRFVVSVAKQFQNPGLSLGDMINEGNVGLVKAASRFDETRGFKFISYAVWWVRQSIMQAIAEKSRIVRIPNNKTGTISKITRAAASLEQQYQREPSTEELATTLNLSTDELEELLKMNSRQLSIDAPMRQMEEGSLLDVLEDESQEKPDAALISDSLKRDVQRSLAMLSERQAEILIMHYGLNGNPPLSLGDIGLKLNLTCERVRQIREKSIRQLRHSSRNKALIRYLG